VVARRHVLLAGSAVVLCAWCGWLSGFHRATTAARVTWGISLALVVVADVLLWQGRRGRRPGLHVEPVAGGWPPPGTRSAAALAGVSPWVILALVVLAWDVLGIDTGKHTAHLTISALTQASRPLNAAMLLVWMAVGLGYGLTRARSPLRPPPLSPASTAGSPAAWWSALPVVTVSAGGTAAWPVPGLLLPNDRDAGVAFWLGVVVVAVVVDVLARRSAGRVADAEQMLRLVTAPMAANAFWVVAWTYAGYHLFAH
jgi:hypothetical protein